MSKKAVKILYPGLTHCGKVYGVGDIEENPDNFLLGLAKSGEKRYHSDLGKEIRMAKLIRSEIGLEEYDDEDDDSFEVVRTPVFVDDEEPDDGLRQRKKSELIVLASSLGFKKDGARKMNIEQLIKLIRALRTI